MIKTTCTRAQIVALIEYILEECKASETLEQCISKIEIMKRKAMSHAVREFLSDFWK